jgi:hypothetical protein
VIVETYRVLTHKQLVALLLRDTVPAGETPKGASAKKKTVRRKTGKMKSASVKKKRSLKNEGVVKRKSEELIQ